MKNLCISPLRRPTTSACLTSWSATADSRCECASNIAIVWQTVWKQACNCGACVRHTRLTDRRTDRISIARCDLMKLDAHKNSLFVLFLHVFYLLWLILGELSAWKGYNYNDIWVITYSNSVYTSNTLTCTSQNPGMNIYELPTLRGPAIRAWKQTTDQRWRAFVQRAASRRCDSFFLVLVVDKWCETSPADLRVTAVTAAVVMTTGYFLISSTDDER